jgi:AraC-like DNA-binding protein/mannose-6-phosphate isomerase-like protein (cupin superfamily)
MGKRTVWFSSGNYLDFRGTRNLQHRHSYYEVCLVLGGKGTFSHGDQVYTLKTGDLFIADPGVIHEIISARQDSLKIQFLSFDFEKREQGQTDEEETYQDRCIEEFLRHHVPLIQECSGLEYLFRSLREASLEDNSMKRYTRNENLTKALIMEIVLNSINGLEERYKDPAMDSRLQAALIYMDDNAFRKLSVEEVSAHAAISARTLRRLMHGYCGMTVIQKCFRIRIEAAARHLLSNPDQTVSEVSYQFGFENPSDFCRGFKKIMYLPPGQFREREGTLFR